MTTEVILKSLEGDRPSTEFAFAGPARVLIGRGSACSLRLDDPTVSRRHCLLEIGEGGASVRDQNSLNGTLVSGRLVGRRHDESEAIPLRDGDVLRVGSHAFLVTVLAEDASRAEPDLCWAGA
jgi:pSer/pThr/pTyr-binding forkhead associated (FHA) protein